MYAKIQNKSSGGLQLWVKWPFQTIFQSAILGHFQERGRKKREMIGERKKSKTTPPAPTASTVGPCPTGRSKISRDAPELNAPISP